MPSIPVRNILIRGQYNNYLIGGNICNAFALGDLGSVDDFFLLGAEPFGESNYPMLTGNILDSEGNVLFRLVRNMLALNPGNCAKILSERVGYQIYDVNGELIFQVATRFGKLPGSENEGFVTTISANLYNKDGDLVFKADPDNGNILESSVKSVYGFSGAFGLVQGFDENEMDIARVMLLSGGIIHKVLSGDISNQEISLDGAAILNARIDSCTINICTGEFSILDPNSSFTNSRFVFSGPAANIRQIVLQLDQGAKH